MEGSKQLTLTEEAYIQLQEGISLVFSRWSEVQDAVNEEFAGPHTRERAFNFEASICNFFGQPNRKRKEPVYIDDLEDLLWEGLASLNLDTLDCIVEEVAKILMEMHEECVKGNYQPIQKLREAMPVPYVKQLPVTHDDDLSDDTSTSMMIDSSDNLANDEIVAQDMELDGWVVYTRRKNKGKSKGMKK